MKRFLSILMMFFFTLLIVQMNGCSDEKTPAGPGDEPEPVVYEWETLIVDADEGIPVNLDTLSVLVTDTAVVFRFDTHTPWADPADPDGGVNAAIFLDMDINAVTGLSAASSYSYFPNDIGADYMIIVGIEGNALLEWDSGDQTWVEPQELNSLMLEPDTTRFEVEFKLQVFGNAHTIDIVAATASWVDNEIAYDFGPDEGHATLDLGSQISSPRLNDESYVESELIPRPVSAWFCQFPAVSIDESGRADQ